jgi:hypothetical protein
MAAQAGAPRDPHGAVAKDEQQASAGARSEPERLLHPWEAVA